MESTTAEQLSRYLDGDLDAAAAELLERRLAAEPELAEELEALRRLRRRVAQVAERMEPPADLDGALLPLIERTPRPVRRFPPAARWLGMAAGVALAVTVAMEVARRAPDRGPTSAPHPRPSAPSAASTELSRRGDQAPPTAAEADAPPAPQASAMKVAEAEAEPPAEGAPRPDKKGVSPRGAEERSAEAADEAKRQAGEAANEGPPAAAEAAAAPVAATAPSAGGREEALLAGKRSPATGADGAAVGPSRLVLYGDGGDSIAELELPPGVALPPAAPLVVAVADGAISGIETADGGDVLALEKLVGRALPHLPDGRYRAGVEVAGSLR